MGISEKSPKESHVDQLLTKGFNLAKTRLAGGSWRTHFAGKEIFHDIGSRICNR